MSSSPGFPTTDALEAIRVATREAEARSGGEIVTVIVGRCTSYAVARWRGACAGALVGAITAGAILAWFGPPWGWGIATAVTWLTLPAMIGAAAGGALVRFVPGVERRLLEAAEIEEAVARRAATAFVEEEVFATRRRTGVLLLFALFEHRVVVLADTGIHDCVPAPTWARVAEEAARALRAGPPGEAIERAIAASGTILAEAPVPRDENDVNELPDEPRVHDA
jgi:putative membrane protein